MSRGRKTALSFGVLAFVAIVVSCREPTEVTVRITSGEKCAELSGVQIVVGRDPNETQQRFVDRYTTALTRDCDANGLVGTLVVTPGGAGGTIVVAAGVTVGGAPAPDPTTCSDATVAKSCIIARRSFSFLEHTSLTLPILLDPLCVGQTCNRSSTCFRGACVPATVTCNGEQCGLVEEHPGEADAGATDGSSSDGAYDADLDGASFEDSPTVDDGATPVKDAMPEADTGGVDASAYTCGGSGFSHFCGMNANNNGVISSGTCADPNDKSRDCCHCTCLGGAIVARCDLSMSGASFYCNVSCPP
jgi:hypothetical protein